MLKVMQGKLLVQPRTSMTNLGNGIQINNETQSRKDIVSGTVLDGTLKGNIIYYPLYAASPITYEGGNYFILDENDVLAYEDDTKDN